MDSICSDIIKNLSAADLLKLIETVRRPGESKIGAGSAVTGEPSLKGVAPTLETTDEAREALSEDGDSCLSTLKHTPDVDGSSESGIPARDDPATPKSGISSALKLAPEGDGSTENGLPATSGKSGISSGQELTPEANGSTENGLPASSGPAASKSGKSGISSGQKLTPGGDKSSENGPPDSNASTASTSGSSSISSALKLTPECEAGSHGNSSKTAESESSTLPGKTAEEEFGDYLKSKCLERYKAALSDHEIRTKSDFADLEESDLDVFCAILKHKSGFRTMLKVKICCRKISYLIYLIIYLFLGA